jgi:hypothetical protein
MRVFICSTVHDLADARGALVHELSQYPGFTVVASEESGFPIKDSAHQHSYDLCLTQLRFADLVIALIDTRYGGAYEHDGETPISITRKEIRLAHEYGIPVWTFVRTSTWDDRHHFKHYIAQHSPTSGGANDRTQLFALFKKEFGSRVDSHLVFDLIDEITRFEHGNWIFNNFHTAKDVLATVEGQLASSLSHEAIIEGTHVRLEERPVPDTFLEYMPRCEKYLPLNRQALAVFELARANQGVLTARNLAQLRSISKQSFDLFSRDFSLLITDAYSGKQAAHLFVTDTTMETMAPSVWRRGDFHLRIVTATQHVARRYGLRPEQYTRVLILPDPATCMRNAEWLATLKYLVGFHREHQVGLGFCWQGIIPSLFDPSYHNFYLLRGCYVGIWDAIHALAFEFDAQTEPRIVEHFNELYDCVYDACMNGKNGFLVGEMGFDELAQRLGTIGRPQI